ncbi:MAG: RimK/LysX family protein [Myxococcota bacterium]|nr:RimK/LysX family protein [Myxococcota bacterium]
MSRARPTPPEGALVIGWREWIALPELGIAAIKVKTDTGARTSAMHADEIERFTARGKSMLTFVVHPLQRDRGLEVRCEAEMIDERLVRSSHGDQQLRPVISTPIEILGVRWNIEVTLTRRDVMGFRMLLGREAMRGHILVDPGRSYLGNASPWKTKKKKRAASKTPTE